MIDPPCPKCPKYLLYPKITGQYLGLHPKNHLIVQLYKEACGDVRVGTFDGAYLQHSLTPESASAVMAMYDDCFNTSLEVRQTWELMWLFDKVATATRQEEENRQKETQRANAKAKAQMNQARR